MISWYLPFSIWLTPLSIILSRSTHIAANGIISFLFYGWVIFPRIYVYHFFFIHSSAGGHLGSVPDYRITCDSVWRHLWWLRLGWCCWQQAGKARDAAKHPTSRQEPATWQRDIWAKMSMALSLRYSVEGFPGGPVVKNPPRNAGDTSSIPGPGRCHMSQSN